MKFRGVLTVVLVCIFAFGCSSSKKVLVDNSELERLMEQEAFEFAVKAVEPQVTMAYAQIASSGMLAPGNTISRIDVEGSGYFLKLNGKKVSANMPYHGERQMGGGYGSDAGITFDGTTENLQITKNEEKKGYKITFSVDNSSENYDFTINLASNLSSTVLVRSSHRNRIRYQGKIAALDYSELQ